MISAAKVLSNNTHQYRLKTIEIMHGSASLHINSVKHAFMVIVYGAAFMLQGRNVLAVLGKVRFIAITHDKRYCLQLDSYQKIAGKSRVTSPKNEDQDVCALEIIIEPTISCPPSP